MTSPTQRWIDRAQVTSGQHWALRAISVAAAVAGVLATAFASGEWWGFGIALVACAALVTSFRPDLHAASFVVILIAWQWLGAVDEVLSPWVLMAALSILTYHSSIALLATVPQRGILPATTLRRWALRTMVVGGATAIVWLVAVAFDGQRWRGNIVLTALAVGVLVGCTALVRARSIVRQRTAN